MLIQLLARKWYLIIISGFFISCTTELQLREAYQYTRESDYENAIQAVNGAIESNPEIAEAHYLKSFILYSRAQQMNNIGSRYSIYTNMKKSVENGLNTFKSDSSIKAIKYRNDVKTLLIAAWRNEYDSAVKHWTEAGSNQQANTNAIIAHGKNAQLIAPDSALTYLLMANGYNQLREYEKANSALQKYLDLTSIQESNYASETGFLLAKSGKPNKAKELLLPPDDSLSYQPTLRTLANSFTHTGKHSQSILMLKRIKQHDSTRANTSGPINIAILEQYYLMFSRKVEALDLNPYSTTPVDTSAHLKHTEFDSLLAITDSALTYTAKIKNHQPELIQVTKIASLHQNMGAYYKWTEQQYPEFESQANKYKRKHLKLAAELYNTAVQAKPNEKQYWDQLYQIYSSLNQKKLAEKALKKSNFNPTQ